MVRLANGAVEWAYSQSTALLHVNFGKEMFFLRRNVLVISLLAVRRNPHCHYVKNCINLSQSTFKPLVIWQLIINNLFEKIEVTAGVQTFIVEEMR
jgi:hypothetical protein